MRLGGDYTQLLNAAAESIPQHDLEARETLRKFLTGKYERDRGSSVARSQNAAFERMKGMAASADLFNVEKLPAKDRERYGPGSFAQPLPDGPPPCGKRGSVCDGGQWRELGRSCVPA